ncbi:C6 zinc finger domain protein [Niveomyces insectorum RCEF 264]|uniref:C6 zinc finger domain protein n=1 Tax=Niveomyces insectorum RCEF 264 TaxID=1081102 RepID=A0A167RFU3_9HYPO|nr:C6 zinc finger domain protein [Niveomyces insectorum RCEF 264]
MVGVPRSRGCLLCVRRRVRCDEGRPGCGKCATYGAECPGYDRSIKFVTGKHHVRRKARNDDSHGGGGDGGGGDGGGGDEAVCETGAAAGAAKEVSLRVAERPAPASGAGSATTADEAAVTNPFAGDQPPSSFPTSTTWDVTSYRAWNINGDDGDDDNDDDDEGDDDPAPVPSSLKLCRAAYINAVLESINLDRPRQDRQFYGSWFNRVPNRLGRKVTLDSAVCAFAMHLLGKSREDAALVIQSRQLYGQSLVALQQALNHPEEWRSSETLCTTMVMCLFELFADTSGSAASWTQHAQAVTRLLQYRGVDGYDDAWDRSMLFSFRSVIIMNALFTGQDCFLAKRKWQRVLGQMVGTDALSVFPPQTIPVIDRHITHLARLPRVMRYCWSFRQNRLHGLPVDPAQVALARRAASALAATFHAWFDEARPYLGDPFSVEVPSNVPPDAPASPYATVLAYPNPWIGCMYLSYLTSLLITQECLNQCAALRAEAAQAEAVAQAMSVDSATTEDAVSQTTDSPASATSLGSSHGEHEHGLSSSTTPEGLTSASPSPPATTSPLRPYDQCNREYCRIIYRSFETLSAGMMGPYRVGFAMRISYEFADVPTQLWIRSLLDRSTKTYASSRAEAYPAPKPNEYNYN